MSRRLISKRQEVLGMSFVTVYYFLRSTIQPHVKYTYRVQPVSNGNYGPLSEPTTLSTTTSYCGDGVINKELNEQCDDANIRDGDGCDSDCQLELGFRCKQEPSLCYRHDRDGECDDLEKEFSSRDCGFFTPKGFKDQWAIKVVGKETQQSSNCPESIMEGKPPVDLKCIPDWTITDTTKYWRPCTTQKDYWIEATYENEAIAAAIIIYLASDGIIITDGGIKNPYNKPLLTIELKDTEGFYHKATNYDVPVTCKNNPMAIHVMHDMTKPVFKTKGVRIRFDQFAKLISIAAIALRSTEREYYHDCTANELYDPRTKRCRPYNKDTLPCKTFELKHATSNCSGNSDGDQCKVSCHVGYRPVESFMTKCELGKWIHDEECKPVDCGRPNFKHILPDCPSTTFGNHCSFTCQPNALFHGDKEGLLVCEANGLWRRVHGHCYTTCRKPQLIENAELYMTDSFPNVCGDKEKKTFDMGSRCRYRCKTGYRPIRFTTGTVTGGNTVNILCNEEGAWKRDGRCEKITCSKLSTMMSYLYECTNENKYKSVCTTNCLGTMAANNTVECTEEGEWSSPFDICETNGNCQKLTSKRGLDMTSCNTNKIGSVCRPQCRRREDSVIPHIVVKGKEDIKEVALYCMPNKQWMPPVSYLRCVNPCVSYELGDGFCDCHNNKKQCNYDGGDCCAKDLSTPVEYFLPSSAKCNCLDPKALQHLRTLRAKQKG